MYQHQKDSLASRCIISTSISMNNEGVGHLKSGDYKTAITTFSCALKSCNQVLACRDGGVDTRSLDEYMALSSSNLNEDENEDGDNQVIYRHAIVVPTETPQRDRISKTGHSTPTATMMTAIIIFNGAIAHQLMALEVITVQQGKRTALKTLCKAASLYEICLTLAQEGEICFSSGSILFFLASINNVALVYEAMNADDVANRCLEELLAALVFVIDYGHSVKFDGFFANTSCLLFSASPAAAAA
jgi:hypothetical protein